MFLSINSSSFLHALRFQESKNVIYACEKIKNRPTFEAQKELNTL